MRSKLISHRTTETLPSGTTITTLHLTPEAKAGLSTNGVEIPAEAPNAIAARESAELTVYDHQQRQSKTAIALHLGTAVAVVLALFGVQPVVCAMLPSIVVSIPVSLWAWRDRQAFKQRRALRELSAESRQLLDAGIEDVRAGRVRRLEKPVKS